MVIHLIFLASIAAPLTLNDNTVLLRLTPLEQRAHASTREIRVTDPLKSAQLALDTARRTGDNRYAGQAQAILANANNDKVIESSLLGAQIAQYLHQFDHAQRLLQRVLRTDPHHVQARLLAAQLAFTQGQWPKATEHCVQLLGRTSHVISHACVTYSKSLQGQLRDSYSLLSSLAGQHNVDDEGGAWVLELLGDMAERVGDDTQAETYWKRAIAQANPTISSLSQLSDYYLRQKRWHDTVTLLESYQQNDVLALRYWHAMRLLGQANPNAEQALLSRWKNSLKTNEQGHERETALALWWFEQDTATALTLAQRNALHQREPADIRLWAALSIQQADQSQKRQLLELITPHHYEDAVLNRLLLEPQS